ncbi:MAG: LuxR C-terminal-related transcriptional regulator [Spirochaetales bacterium]|nr:LuxR C-terminal-related transcriptional regulator [Spirochaetales bacterium]MCF7938803.1 LuxR C-terminal-related transcriptional regulator [Spirochaetales bacterium]
MGQYLVFLYFAAAFVAVVSLGFLVYSWTRRRTVTLAGFILIIFAENLYLFSGLVFVYRRVNTFEPVEPVSLLVFILSLISEILLVGSIPFIIRRMVPRRHRPLRIHFFWILAGIYLVSLVLIFHTESRILIDIRRLMRLNLYLFGFFLIMPYIRNLQTVAGGQTVRIFGTVTFLYYPAALGLVFLRYYLQEEGIGIVVPSPLLFYNILLNIFSLYIALHFLLKESQEPVNSLVDSDGYNLSEREYLIVDLIARAYSNAEIGEALNLSSQTVRNYIYRIYQKVGVHNRIELLNALSLKDQKE